MSRATCKAINRLDEKILYCRDLVDRVAVFRDRADAGVFLSSVVRKVLGEEYEDLIVIGLVAGGVPVAVALSREIKAKLDVVVVKKILYPWTTEAGFGAVAPDGRFEYDENIAHVFLGYDKSTVEKLANEVYVYVRNRTLKVRGNLDYSNIEGRKVLVVDDGIATGYTMIVCVNFLRRVGAEKVYVAVPTSSLDGAIRVSKYSDLVIVANLRRGDFFAVADAYVEWHDVSDEELVEVLGRLDNSFNT